MIKIKGAKWKQWDMFIDGDYHRTILVSSDGFIFTLRKPIIDDLTEPQKIQSIDHLNRQLMNCN